MDNHRLTPIDKQKYYYGGNKLKHRRRHISHGSDSVGRTDLYIKWLGWNPERLYAREQCGCTVPIHTK